MLILNLDAQRFPTNQHDRHHDNWTLSDTIVNGLDPSESVRMNDCGEVMDAAEKSYVTALSALLASGRHTPTPCNDISLGMTQRFPGPRRARSTSTASI